MVKIKTAQQLMQDNLIVKHYAGSIAYGTNLPTSDTDFRGIFIADPINIRTPFYPVKQATDASEEDTSIYELANFMKLALDCNPNVIETLWVDDSDIVYRTDAYDILRAHAPKLLSSKIAFTTSGYALAQLKRIKGHNKWINNPQTVEPPRQCDYVSLVHNFTQAKTLKFFLSNYYYGHRLVPFSGGVYGLYEARGYSPFNADTGALNDDYEGDTHELGVPLFLVKFNKDVYNAAKETHAHYWEWKKTATKSVRPLKSNLDTIQNMQCIWFACCEWVLKLLKLVYLT